MSDPIFIKPFGPVIYSNLLDGSILQILKECKTASENLKDDFGYLLAGAIEKQYRVVRTQEHDALIKNHIFEHIATYLGVDLEHVKEKFFFNDNSIWLNIQKAGEFNPPHHHDGHFSGVIYLEIPEEIAREKDKNPVGFRGYGEISFYYGEDILCPTYFHMLPRVGQIILFPAKLKHAVHPFYSDVERVSIAFNVFKEPEFRNPNIDITPI